jgi:putative phage-type endonuclease
MNSSVQQLINQSIEAHTDKWYDVRDTMITASDVGSVIGINKYKSRAELLEQKSLNVRHDGNDIVNHGLKNEIISIQILERMINKRILEIGLMVHPKYSFIGATPDGITEDGEELIEIKNPVNRKITGNVPFYYYAQVQTQLEVLNKETCYFFETNIKNYDSKSEFENKKYIECGQHEDGVWWVLFDYSLQVVKRDYEWFSSLIPILKNFSDDLKALKQKKNRKKRSRKEYEEKPLQRKKKFSYVNEKFFHLFSEGDNYGCWLEIHGNHYHSISKTRNGFFDCVTQKMQGYKTEFMKELNKQYSNECERLPQHHTHNEYLTNMTQEKIDRKVPIIINPHLSVKYLDKLLFCNPDMLVRVDYMDKLFPNNKNSVCFGRTDTYVIVNVKKTTLHFNKNGNKLLSKHKTWINKSTFENYVLSKMIGKSIRYTFFIGYQAKIGNDKLSAPFENIGVVDHIESNSNELINNYINWVKWIYNKDNKKDIENDNEFLPFYSSSGKSSWNDYVKQQALENKDVSVIYNIGRKVRTILHANNIFTWDNPRLLNVLKTQSNLSDKKISIIEKMINMQLNKYNHDILPLTMKYNTKNWMAHNRIEYYVDYETVNTLFCDKEITYLIGCLVVFPNGKRDFKKYLASDLTDAAEKSIFEEWINDMNRINREWNVNYEPNIYCWSDAENIHTKKAEIKSNTKYNINFVDFCKIMNQEEIILKNNITGFKLKNITKVLYDMGMITTVYKGGCNSGDMSIIYALEYYDDKTKKQKELQELVHYNYLDCYSMYEIVIAFRNHFSK